MTINTYNDKQHAVHVLAGYIVQLGNEAIEERGRFTLALAGGKTPQDLHRELSTPPLSTQLDWTKVFFFFGDERYVPENDPESNYRMASETLFRPLDILPEQVFKVNTSLDPEAAARDYQDKLDHFFNNNPVRFDLILLGMGDNAHIASLFPYSPVLHDSEPAVRAVELPEQHAWRITMNAPMINNAARIAFLVTGADKAPALKHVLDDDPEKIVIDLYPAQLIRNERVAWFTDLKLEI